MNLDRLQIKFVKFKNSSISIFVLCSLTELSSQSGTGNPPSSKYSPYSKPSATKVIPPNMWGGLRKRKFTFPEGHSAQYLKISYAVDQGPRHTGRYIKEYVAVPAGIEYDVWASDYVVVGFWENQFPEAGVKIPYHEIMYNQQPGVIELKGQHVTRKIFSSESQYVKENPPRKYLFSNLFLNILFFEPLKI